MTRGLSYSICKRMFPQAFAGSLGGGTMAGAEVKLELEVKNAKPKNCKTSKPLKNNIGAEVEKNISPQHHHETA